MTKSSPDIPILDDDAVAQIEFANERYRIDWRYPAQRTRIAALCREWRALRAEIADYEQTDLVPRGRYNAVDAEAREAREQTKQLAHRAGAEIDSLHGTIC